ncbi:hypothetical protein LJ655_09510 [Paraburkholderia sp. MMS20-SJTN17]|uniref:Uncharacterized protein n=1 Tax=Paraburkholderia translucens TaxID=2886945 RepID=A0ABS8KBH9_9BURK|nr:hypothetical protein [Paraburkholderia sp. MMS20-SJTN17]MCC8402126.1 hypothetical protein [Paraburkholderia sp. MMS20-SJTN17]
MISNSAFSFALSNFFSAISADPQVILIVRNALHLNVTGLLAACGAALASAKLAVTSRWVGN